MGLSPGDLDENGLVVGIPIALMTMGAEHAATAAAAGIGPGLSHRVATMPRAAWTRCRTTAR